MHINIIRSMSIDLSNSQKLGQKAANPSLGLGMQCEHKQIIDDLDESKVEVLSQIFRALSDPARIRILALVSSAGCLCSCDLGKPLGKSQSTISHHTTVLFEAGLIEGEKRGKWTYWSLKPGVAEIIKGLLQLDRVD